MDMVTKWRIGRLIKNIPYRLIDISSVLVGCFIALVFLVLVFINSAALYHTYQLHIWLGEIAWIE